MIKMATVQLFVLCLLAFNYAHCLSEEYETIEDPNSALSHLKQFVLDAFNDNKESIYEFNHANVLDAQKRDGPERSYFMLLDIDVLCKKDDDCDTKNLICEVIVKEDLTSEKREISEDDSVCVKKLPPSLSMVNNQGFVEGSVSDDVQRVAELAVEQLENDGDTKRTIFEIMSVKTQNSADGKKLFLTLKVAKTIDDAVDMTEFETCEIELSMNDPLTVENSTSCFPVSEGQTDYSMSEEDMNEEAKKAVNEINKLSSSPFQHVLVKVITADRSVTPGSQGSVTTIQFQVAPSFCLKSGGGERESPAVRNCPPASTFESLAPLQCTLTAWERPWHPSTPTLYSGPVCSTEKEGVSEEDVSSSSVSDLSEELDTTDEPRSEKKFAYCTGCPIDMDVESDSVRTLAQEVLTSMETSFAHRLVRVVKAQKQVVNGVKYIMTLEVVRTACPPEAARIDLNGCPEIDGEEDGGVRTCHIEVIERPWADSAREVIVNDCSGESPAKQKDSGNVLASPDSTSTPKEESDLNEVVQAFDEMFGDDPRAAGSDVELFDESEDLQEESNDVPLIALMRREKRSINDRSRIGGLRDVLNDEKDRVSSYARYALETMNALAEDRSKRRLEEIVSAQKQIENGYVYHLKFKVSTSDCNANATRNECKTANKQQYLCKAKVHQTSGSALRLLNSECSPIMEQNVLLRTRRIPGGKIHISVNDSRVTEKIDFVIDHLTARSEGDYKKAPVKVLKAEFQVVSGFIIHLQLKVGDSVCRKNETTTDCPLQENTSYKVCYVAIWEQAWLNSIKVWKSNCVDVGKEEETLAEEPGFSLLQASNVETDALARERRSVQGPALLGGLKDVLNEERDQVLKWARFSLERMDDIDEDMDKRILEDIESAHKQRVNGVVYHLILRVATSNCDEKATKTDCSRGELSKKHHYRCKAKVHISSGSESIPHLLSSECTPAKEMNRQHRNRRNVGVRQNLSVDDPVVTKNLDYAIDHISAFSEGDYKKVPIQVLKAERQMVSGTLLHLKLKVGDSTCRKDADVTGDCPVQDDVPYQICYIAIWERIWLKKKEILNSTCENSGNRQKREIENPDKELYSEMFSNFMSKYNKNYATEEERQRRFRIFRANMKKVKVLQETEQGTATYGATQFADLSAKEFKKYYLGFNPNVRQVNTTMRKAEIPNVRLPPEFDWRHYNVVTEVKNQGMCGSCWAFSVTGNVEGQYAIHHGKLVSLSEQELVDCDKLDQGCGGGLMDQAYHAIENLGGLEDEQDYPYIGYGEQCHFKKNEAFVTLSGSVNISSSEDDMARWLYKKGPISIALNANAMQFYFGGVSHPWKILCDPESLDHGVLIVGYGVHRTSILHRTLPYWIIKNSWGPNWGEQGYYRIYRGDGTCGVNKMATSAFVN